MNLVFTTLGDLGRRLAKLHGGSKVRGSRRDAGRPAMQLDLLEARRLMTHVTFTTSSATVAEGGSDIVIGLHRDPATSGTLASFNATFSAAGDGDHPASAGDYSLSGDIVGGNVHFEGGNTAAFITVHAVNDTAVEYDEGLTLKVCGDDSSTATASLTIQDDDAPSIGISSVESGITEGDYGHQVVTRTSTGSGHDASTVTVTLICTGDASDATDSVDDYSTLWGTGVTNVGNGTYTFEMGPSTASKTLTWQALSDTEVEPTGTLSFSICGTTVIDSGDAPVFPADQRTPGDLTSTGHIYDANKYAVPGTVDFTQEDGAAIMDAFVKVYSGSNDSGIITITSESTDVLTVPSGNISVSSSGTNISVSPGAVGTTSVDMVVASVLRSYDVHVHAPYINGLSSLNVPMSASISYSCLIKTWDGAKALSGATVSAYITGNAGNVEFVDSPPTTTGEDGYVTVELTGYEDATNLKLHIECGDTDFQVALNVSNPHVVASNTHNAIGADREFLVQLVNDDDLPVIGNIWLNVQNNGKVTMPAYSVNGVTDADGYFSFTANAVVAGNFNIDWVTDSGTGTVGGLVF